MYSGRQPAITAFAATTSAVTSISRLATLPITVSGASATTSRNWRTTCGVGGTSGSPSDHWFSIASGVKAS
jgi:hypothetical protein